MTILKRLRDVYMVPVLVFLKSHHVKVNLAHLEPVDAFRQHATSRKAGSLGRAKEHPATARYVDDLFPAVDDEKLLEATEVSLDESSADEVIGA